MPTYDYQCRSCGSVTEVIHSMREEGPSICEVCGGELRRVLYPTGIIFKGSGFYRTDSRKAESTPAGSTEAKTASTPGSGSDGGTTPKKPKGDPSPAKPSTEGATSAD